MKSIAIISLITIFPLICRANPNLETEIDDLIIYHTFSGDWALADSLLEAQISEHPDSPKYYSLKGPYYFYTRYYNQGVLDNDSLMQKMAEYATMAIETGKNKNEMTLDDKFFVGTAYGYLSRYYGRQFSIWNAYWAASNCRSYLNEVLEEDPSYTDAKMGLAVIEYFSATQLGGFWRFVAWVIGMSGNRDTAMMQFHDVAENGYWFKDEAKFVLAVLYRSVQLEYDVAQAEELSNQLYEKYPQNIFLLNQYDQMRFLALIDEKGVEILETEFDSLQTKYQVANDQILNGFGYNLLFNSRFDEAIVVLRVNMKLFPDVANCYDSLSEAYLTAGNPDMAIYYSRRCLEKLPGDTTINNQFRYLLQSTSEERIESLGGDTGKVNI
jgi:hypothetical protein